MLAVMDPKRYAELKKIAQTVMRAWNGGTSFNDAYFNTPFGQYILSELEKVMYPEPSPFGRDANVRDLTAKDAELLAKEPKPLKILIPVTIEEEKTVDNQPVPVVDPNPER